MTKPLDISKLTMPDGTSVQDRVDALCNALKQHGQRGFMILMDQETGQIYLAGQLPDQEQMAKILEHAAEGIHKGEITYEDWPKKQ